MKKTIDLPCYDHRSSFYGKAVVVTDESGKRTLRSYRTDICSVIPTGELVKLDPVASAPTRRHIRSFFQHVGLVYKDNDWWDHLPLQVPVSLKGGVEA